MTAVTVTCEAGVSGGTHIDSYVDYGESWDASFACGSVKIEVDERPPSVIAWEEERSEPVMGEMRMWTGEKWITVRDGVEGIR